MAWMRGGKSRVVRKMVERVLTIGLPFSASNLYDVRTHLCSVETSELPIRNKHALSDCPASDPDGQHQSKCGNDRKLFELSVANDLAENETQVHGTNAITDQVTDGNHSACFRISELYTYDLDSADSPQAEPSCCFDTGSVSTIKLLHDDCTALIAKSSA